jgi:hypothetical protein
VTRRSTTGSSAACRADGSDPWAAERNYSAADSISAADNIAQQTSIAQQTERWQAAEDGEKAESNRTAVSIYSATDSKLLTAVLSTAGSRRIRSLRVWWPAGSRGASLNQGGQGGKNITGDLRTES